MWLDQILKMVDEPWQCTHKSMCTFLNCFNILSARDKKNKTTTTKFAKTLYPDEAAHNELPHLDQYCFPSSLYIINMIQFEQKQFLKFVACFSGA